MNILFLSALSFLFITDANAFISKKKERERQEKEAHFRACTQIAVQYTYQSIQERYSHWKYNRDDFSSQFSWVDPKDESLVVHVKEKNYRFEHKIFLDSKTCEVIGHESMAF